MGYRWQQNTGNILPLLIDTTNLTPAYGFANTEPISFLQRILSANINCNLALALLHHLCILHNCHFKILAELFVSTAHYLIVEFVDRQDSRVIELLANMRENYHVFNFYCEENFITEFELFFKIIHIHKITNTGEAK